MEKIKKSLNPTSVEFQNKIVNALSFSTSSSSDLVLDCYSQVMANLILKVSPDLDTINRALRKNQLLEITYSSKLGTKKITLEQLNSLIYRAIKNAIITEKQSKRTKKTFPLLMQDSNGKEFFNPSIIVESPETDFEIENKNEKKNKAIKKAINELIASIPEKFNIYKELIILNCKLRISQKEAAEILGIDDRAYRVRLWRLKTQILPTFVTNPEKNPALNAIFA